MKETRFCSFWKTLLKVICGACSSTFDGSIIYVVSRANESFFQRACECENEQVDERDAGLFLGDSYGSDGSRSLLPTRLPLEEVTPQEVPAGEWNSIVVVFKACSLLLLLLLLFLLSLMMFLLLLLLLNLLPQALETKASSRKIETDRHGLSVLT